MLGLVRSKFARVIVLLNTANLIDLSFIDRFAPDAVLLVWQGGMTGGTGTAAVLTGAVSPSGKLTDTAAFTLADYPSDAYFGDPNANCYAEDIYVGYRYFETFAPEKVRYPFGYGLSYTTFAVSADSLTAGQHRDWMLTVTVRNTGSFPGKEAVQIYCEAPQGTLGQPKRQLIAFRKTTALDPGACETVQIPLTLPSSYDEAKHAWVRENGAYRIYCGSDVRSASLAGTVYADSSATPEQSLTPCEPAPGCAVIEQCEQAMAPVQAFDRIRPVETADGLTMGSEAVPTLTVDEEQRLTDALPAEFAKTEGTFTLADVKHGTCTLEAFIAQLSDTELCQIVRGEGMGSPRVTAGTAAAFGGVTDALEAYGIPAGCCSDGPSGMRLDCGTKAFSLPIGTMLASTFNTALITELFACVGLEMTANRVDCLLGPGMNIHRHPRNGRNFEYFSEDPLLTGEIAAAELIGLHSAGVEGTVKHCCGNNQETNRHFLNSVVSERALREIYLKGFEIAVKKGGAKSVMTTYGAVNGVWTACNYDLCTQIIRREWGFDGFLMTDWWANLNRRGEAPCKTDLAAMVRAQNDVYMVCADSAEHEDNLEAALADGSLSRAELQRSAANLCRFLLHTHAMERLTGDAPEITVINRPAGEESADEPVEFFDVADGTVLDLSQIGTERGTTYPFALTVAVPGWYRVTLTASSAQSETAQIPVTIFNMGTASGTFTWNGTDGKAVSYSAVMPLFSHFTTMRLYFAQSGLNMHAVGFTLVSDNFSPTALSQDDFTEEEQA
jgi:beta-glucosidase